MNLLSLIQNQLSPQTIAPISNSIGESPAATKSALATAVPGLLGALVGKASASPNGVTDLFNMLKQGSNQGTWSDSLSNLAQRMTGGAPSEAQKSLLGSILGPKLGPVSDFIAGHTGIRSSSAMSLLGMAAPLLMGTLSKQVSSQGLGAAGFGKLLNSQIPYLGETLPPGLTDTLGLNNVLSGAQKIALPDEVAHQRAPMTSPARGVGALKWAGIVALLAIIGWLVGSHSNRRLQVGGTSETNLSSVATGQGYGRPDLSSLNLPPGGIGENLAKAISSGDQNKTIDLPGFTTDDSGALADSARTGVGEISKVLSAAPNVKVRITGHGPTDQAARIQADSIRNALVATGISEDRISTGTQTASGTPTLSLEH